MKKETIEFEQRKKLMKKGVVLVGIIKGGKVVIK